MFHCSCRFLRILFTIVVLGSAINILAAGDDQAKFDKAWSMFGSGNYASAKVLVSNSLEKGIDNLSLRANFYYLQGHLSAKDVDSSQEAIDAFLNALQLYTEVGSNYGSFNTQTSLAKVYAAQERFAEAQTLLEDSLLLAGEADYPKGYVYGLMARIAIENEDFNEALSYSEKSLSAYEAKDDQNGIANTLTQKGLVLLTLGRYSEGHLATLNAQSMMIAAGNQYKHAYTIANLILYHRCYGLDVSGMVEQVSAIAKKENDGDLLELLEFVTTYECVQEQQRVMDHQDPPPPPPAYPKPPS